MPRLSAQNRGLPACRVLVLSLVQPAGGGVHILSHPPLLKMQLQLGSISRLTPALQVGFSNFGTSDMISIRNEERVGRKFKTAVVRLGAS